MKFNSFEYVLFLWTSYVLFWTFKERRSIRHSLILVGSYWFYAQADWRFTFLLLFSTVVDWFAGNGIDRARRSGRDGAKKAWLFVSLCGNLGMLGFFKYYDFFVDSIEEVLASLGREGSLWHLSAERGGPLDYIVPAGISFYTFQTLSYTIDIYRGRLKPSESALDFAMYVSFFPQLIAGPIVRAADFLPQMAKPPALRRDDIGRGLFLILRGMAKKLLIADVIALHVVDPIYADADAITRSGAIGAMLATYGFALQMYCDFAGYSDIAIGSAQLLGFKLRRNFDSPWKSRSLEEFWTRWHISMSFWFYYYVFDSLGGNRGRLITTCRNLFLTHFLSGVWHGAGWNYVLWGIWFGVWMVGIRVLRTRLPNGKMPRTRLFSLLGILFTFHVAWVSGMLIRVENTGEIFAWCRALTDWSVPVPSFPWQIWTIFLVGYVSHFTPDQWDRNLLRWFQRVPSAIQALIVLAAILVFFGLAPPGIQPFLYFQF